MTVHVLGSVNMDLVVRSPRHPKPGETLIGSSARHLPGGKGANQAVACRHTGAPTRFLGCVGDDGHGAALLRFLSAHGLDASAVRVAAGQPSGLALITVDDRGENTIVVVPGANAAVSPADADVVPVERGDLLVAQLEVPLDAVGRFLSRGREAGATTILNAAPARPLGPEVLSLVDVLVVNETELALLAGGGGVVEGMRRLAAGSVITTLGGRGHAALIGGRTVSQPGYAVEVRDTTGAGDCFVGSFAGELARCGDREAALRYAAAAAALCVQRDGAAPAMPARAEVLALLAH